MGDVYPTAGDSMAAVKLAPGKVSRRSVRTVPTPILSVARVCALAGKANTLTASNNTLPETRVGARTSAPLHHRIVRCATTRYGLWRPIILTCAVPGGGAGVSSWVTSSCSPP